MIHAPGCPKQSELHSGPCPVVVAGVGKDALTIEAVDHPAHYAASSVEVIDAIEAWELGFCLGNTVKYVARAGKKDPAKELEDCRKAAWYLQRHIKNLETRDAAARQD